MWVWPYPPYPYPQRPWRPWRPGDWEWWREPCLPGPFVPAVRIPQPMVPRPVGERITSNIGEALRKAREALR